MSPDNVDLGMAIRGGALYVPVVLVVVVGIVRRPDRRTIVAAFVATMWQLPALLAVNQLALATGWWTFGVTGATVAGVPVECWLGWAVLWGAVPVLALGRLLAHAWALIGAGVVLVAVDLVAMPAMGPAAAPVVVLGDGWLVGELVAVIAALLPSLVLGRWTATGTNVCGRAAMQILVFAGTTLYVVPSLVFAVTGETWAPLLARSRTELVLAGLLLAPFAAIALQGVRELSERGGGTPFPYDPPARLVTTGPYAYVANPMQLGATVLLAGLGVLLSSIAVVAAAAGAAVFSAGFAAWHENLELTERHGNRWVAYRRHVRPWLPRWLPYVDPAVGTTAVVYAASTCEQCDEVREFLVRRRRHGLDVVAAELAGRPLRRLTYVGADGHTADGLAGLARALEHVHLGWAVTSAIVRVPGLRDLLQLINDAVGAGPRDLAPTGQPTSSSRTCVAPLPDGERSDACSSITGRTAPPLGESVSPRSPDTPACAAGGGSRTFPTG